VEGQNILIDVRAASADANLRKKYAAELASLSPDAILTGSTTSTMALRDATVTIPIVFGSLTDPVGSGLVKSLSRPGGNITGFTNYEYSMGGKWLEILKEIAPSVHRVAVILNADNPSSVAFLRAIQTLAASTGVQVTSGCWRDPADADRALGMFAQGGDAGLIVLPGSSAYRDQIIGLPARHGLPAVYDNRIFALAGA
jgi:putative ABC transport system substrate-binding protein